MLIHDLTEKYGPVIRQGKVTGVLDSAFDIVVVSSTIAALASRQLTMAARVCHREARSRRQAAVGQYCIRRAP